MTTFKILYFSIKDLYQVKLKTHLLYACNLCIIKLFSSKIKDIYASVWDVHVSFSFFLVKSNRFIASGTFYLSLYILVATCKQFPDCSGFLFIRKKFKLMISLIMNWNILLFICYYIENKACVWHVNSYITFTAESLYFPSLIIVENRVQIVDFVEVVMKVLVVCT